MEAGDPLTIAFKFRGLKYERERRLYCEGKNVELRTWRAVGDRVVDQAAAYHEVSVADSKVCTYQMSLCSKFLRRTPNSPPAFATLP